MDFDNALSDSMVKRVISFVVAVIIVSVVAIPVVNALTDENGSDGGDSETITYTNSGDFYYKSATADSNEHTLKIQTSPGSTESILIITVLSDNVSVYETEVTMPEDDGTVPASDSILLAVCKDTESNEIDYLILSNMYGVTWFVEGGELGGGVAPALNPETDESGNMCWLFTIQNGKITQTSEDESMTFDCLCYLSATGEYVLANAPVKVAPNNEIFAFGTTIVDDPEHSRDWGCTTYSSFDARMLRNGNNTIPLVSQHEFVTETTADLSCTVTDMITVNSMSVDVSMSLESRDGTYHLTATSDNLNLLVPVTVTIDPSAPVEIEVTVTNSGQTYKELDNNSHNIHTETTTNGGITTVTVFSDDAEIMSFNRIDGDYTPKICLAFGEEGSVWLTNCNSLLMINRDGTVVNMATGSTYIDIINKTYDSHTYGTVNLEYFISNDGEYVYSDTAMASKTGQIFNIGISLCDVGESYPIFASVQSNGTPVSALNNVQIHGYHATIVNSTAHYTDGNYVKLDGLDVTYSFTYDETDYTVDYSTNGFFVPKTFTYTESPDSGSDSDSSSNMTNTLIKTIPIFLVLGLLVAFALPMVQGKFE